MANLIKVKDTIFNIDNIESIDRVDNGHEYCIRLMGHFSHCVVYDNIEDRDVNYELLINNL